MEWSSPNVLAEFINAVAPSVIGGLIALAGVILLFFLQQRAQRRSEQRARLDAAANHLMETLEAARRAYTGKVTDPNLLGDMYTKSWRFAWLLEKKERPIADWAWAVLFAAVNETASGGRGRRISAMHNVFLEVMVKLHDWHTGVKKPSWFVEDLARRKAEASKANA
jgi:hypothetical protein